MSIPTGDITINLINRNFVREIGMARNLDVEYKMRMAQELKEKIVESAKEHNRSMNADIVARLEQSFNQKTFGIEEPERKELLDAIMNLQYMIGDHRKMNEKLLEEIEALKKTK